MQKKSCFLKICDRVKNHGWTVIQDSERRMGPYAFHGNQWVSYDDAATIRLKVRADSKITVIKLFGQGQSDDSFLKHRSRISVSLTE